MRKCKREISKEEYEIAKEKYISETSLLSVRVVKRR